MRMLTAALAAALPVAAFAADPQPSPRVVVEALFDALNRHDTDAILTLYAPTATLIQSDSCKPIIGAAAIKANEDALIEAMPDIRVEVVDWVISGNRVAVQFKGYSQKLAPAGEMLIADFFTVEDGKITRDVTIYNAGHACS